MTLGKLSASLFILLTIAFSITTSLLMAVSTKYRWKEEETIRNINDIIWIPALIATICLPIAVFLLYFSTKEKTKNSAELLLLYGCISAWIALGASSSILALLVARVLQQEQRETFVLVSAFVTAILALTVIFSFSLWAFKAVSRLNPDREVEEEITVEDQNAVVGDQIA